MPTVLLAVTQRSGPSSWQANAVNAKVLSVFVPRIGTTVAVSGISRGRGLRAIAPQRRVTGIGTLGYPVEFENSIRDSRDKLVLMDEATQSVLTTDELPRGTMSRVGAFVLDGYGATSEECRAGISWAIP
jgi:hypothetical protein